MIFLKLEEFIDDDRHGMALHLEPKGLLFAEVNISITKKICDKKNIFCNFSFTDQIPKPHDFQKTEVATPKENIQTGYAQSEADEHQYRNLGSLVEAVFQNSQPT